MLNTNSGDQGLSATVAICVVTHNSAKVIGRALDAALAQEGVAVEVHVWDNASRDATREEIARRPAVRLHASPLNLGFCAANNELLAATQTPYVLLLNPDTELRPDCVRLLVAALAASPPRVAGVGPKLWRFDGDAPVMDSAGMVLSKADLSPHDRGQGEIDRGQFDQPGDYFGPSLACALLRREAVDALAIDGRLLDEALFAYYEDVDLAWRARRLGWSWQYEPRAICLHRRGHPQAHGPALAARAFVNRYLLLIANEDGVDGWGYLWRLLPRELLRMIWLTVRQPGFGVAWRMLRDGWRGAWARRRLIAARAGGA